MGVDAQMVVAAPQWLDDRALLRLAYETASAFGPQKFWVNRDGKYGDPSHCLERGTSYRLVPPVAAETTFRVRLWTRYYGEGYERGDLPLILGLNRWFQTKLPGCTVYYDGDTDESLAELTAGREAELWLHFCTNQHRPYIDHGQRSIFGPRDGITDQHCDFCDERMMRNGWGYRYGAFWCPGCGLRIETRDGGRTWTDLDRERDDEVPAVGGAEDVNT